jgi:membrane protease subunit HflK
MPWNQNSGGWKGGGGPWGSGPQQSGPQTPDLEELLRRGQDRLRRALPPGGRGNLAVVALVAVAVVGLWLLNAIYTVQPDELGQELVFGQPKDAVSEPGLHFHFWPVETVEKVNVRQQREFLGSGGAARGAGRDASLMLAADQSIVDIDFSVIWRVSDPKSFLFNIAEPEAFVRRVAESAMREIVGRSVGEDVRTDARAQVEEAVLRLVQSSLDSYEAGITIVGVQLERADPPAEVIDAFEEVQRAQQDQERFQREAEQYANRRIGEANGEASQIREAALGYKEQVVAEAEGDSRRFLSVYNEYKDAKDVTRKRLYLETMERVLGGSNKVILEEGAGSGVLPYLPLRELQPRQESGQQRQQRPENSQ